jgi:hypothetical protein
LTPLLTTHLADTAVFVHGQCIVCSWKAPMGIYGLGALGSSFKHASVDSSYFS